MGIIQLARLPFLNTYYRTWSRYMETCIGQGRVTLKFLFCFYTCMPPRTVRSRCSPLNRNNTNYAMLRTVVQDQLRYIYVLEQHHLIMAKLSSLVKKAAPGMAVTVSLDALIRSGSTWQPKEALIYVLRCTWRPKGALNKTLMDRPGSQKEH